MTIPEQMLAWLNTLGHAADVVDAIDRPELARHRGWDLTGWSYRLVPWGVRFTFRAGDHVADAEVLAVHPFTTRADNHPASGRPPDLTLRA